MKENPDIICCSCGVATLKDYKSDNLAELLRTELYNLKGEYPKIVLSNVHRKKLDPNRAVDEATFGQLVPMMVYDWYHGNISEAISVLGGTAGLLLDIHGYSNDNSIDWTELGKHVSELCSEMQSDREPVHLMTSTICAK